MCMKAKTPDIKQPEPSPTPVAQTDDMAQKTMVHRQEAQENWL